MGERGDIKVEHRLHSHPIAGVKFPVVAEARIVDQKIDVELFGGKPIGQGKAIGRGGEVGLENPDIQAGMKAEQVASQFLETIVATGDKNHARGEGSELAGKFRPEPRGGSGDKRSAALEKSHHSAVWLRA